MEIVLDSSLFIKANEWGTAFSLIKIKIKFMATCTRAETTLNQNIWYKKSKSEINSNIYSYFRVTVSIWNLSMVIAFSCTHDIIMILLLFLNIFLPSLLKLQLLFEKKP